MDGMLGRAHVVGGSHSVAATVLPVGCWDGKLGLAVHPASHLRLHQQGLRGFFYYRVVFGPLDLRDGEAQDISRDLNGLTLLHNDGVSLELLQHVDLRGH